MKNIKIGFIGCGNMGEAMLAGMLKSSKIDAKQIYVHTYTQEKMSYLKDKYKVQTVKDNSEVINNANVIILATKPDKYKDVLSVVKSSLTNEHIVISITPSFTINELNEMVDNKSVIVRTMPNTPSLVNMGMTGVVFDPNHSNNEYKNLVLSIFKTFGEVLVIEEDKIAILSSLSGSSPAFIYLFAKSFLEFGMHNGFTEQESKLLFTKTMQGSAEMIYQSNESIDKLVSNVCSPKGSTIEGINSLKTNKFNDILSEGIEKTTKRFNKMMEKNNN